MGKKSSSYSSSSTANANSSSVLDKLKQLRDFVGGDSSFTESDLSTCLRESSYNVHVAAERLITGSFQPSKKSRHHNNINDHYVMNDHRDRDRRFSRSDYDESSSKPAAITPAATAAITPAKPATAAAAVLSSSTSTTTTTTITTSNSQSDPAASAAATAPDPSAIASASTVNPVTPKTPQLSSSSSSAAAAAMTTSTTSTSTRNNNPTNVQPTTTTSSLSSNSRVTGSGSSHNKGWLLCERWISDGINIARNGSCQYREPLYVKEPPKITTTTTPTSSSTATSSSALLRFRSKSERLIGTFPKQVSNVLSPLVHGGYVRLTAFALMEQSQLPTGSHVALSLSVWIVDPPAFFQIFEDAENNRKGVSNTKQFFDNNSSKKKNATKKDGPSPTNFHSHHRRHKMTLVECAFQLLQWAQNGTPLEDLIELTPTNNAKDATSSSDDDSDDDQIMDADEFDKAMDGSTTNVDGQPTGKGQDEEKAVPDWAQTIVDTTDTASNCDSTAGANDNENGTNLSNKASSSLQEKWLELDTPDGMNVELRPYQKLALHWMCDREQNPDFTSSSSSVDKSDGDDNDVTDRNREQRLTAWKAEQIQLLKELAQSKEETTTPDGMRKIDVFRPLPPGPHEHPILCECGPVRIDLSRVESPAVSSMIENQNGDVERMSSTAMTSSETTLAHPLWERRYLTDPSMNHSYSFFVQPFLGMAKSSPPPPPVPCRGGIVADEMGLGKTVMLLALVQASKNKDKSLTKNSIDPKRSHNDSTLIVTPLSLLSQWQEEIETKTSLTCKGYYGDVRKNMFSFANEKVDVILTTYGTLQSEYSQGRKDAFNQRGFLFSQRWKRIILDETHQIKNHTTLVSRACSQVDAECRWCVSGTIIQNSLDDVYALMRFLKHEPWSEYGFWKTAISTLPDLGVALDRVKRLLAPIMIRRTKNSLGKDGKPILTLPDIDYEAVKVEFSPAERQFYAALYKKSFDIFHGFVKAGTASTSWLKIFSLIHRLRQTCSHVALTVKSHVNDEEWSSQVLGEKDETNQPETRTPNNLNTTEEGPSSNVDSIDDSFLNELYSQFRNMQSGMENGPSHSGDPGSSYAFSIAKKGDDAIQNGDLELKEECPICLDELALKDTVVTPCLHLFCRKCLSDSAVVSNSKSRKVVKCPLCQEEFLRQKAICLEHISGKEYQKRSLDDDMPVGSNATSVDQGVHNNSFGENTMGDARKTLQTALQGAASSKLGRIQEELEKIWAVHPGSKVLIFSQFLGFLDIMEKAFTADRIRTWRLDGKLSLKERTAVLREFGNASPNAKLDQVDEDIPDGKKRGSVLLISMKAGGQGLNLVSARSVFIVDPWWNGAVEDQCINRIHRIGQTADKVIVRKFYVADSIEERIIELQRRKKTIASAALADQNGVEGDSSSGANRPSLDDFKLLFRDEEMM